MHAGLFFSVISFLVIAWIVSACVVGFQNHRADSAARNASTNESVRRARVWALVEERQEAIKCITWYTETGQRNHFDMWINRIAEIDAELMTLPAPASK